MRIFILILINLIAFSSLFPGETSDIDYAAAENPSQHNQETSIDRVFTGAGPGEGIGTLNVPALGIVDTTFYYLPSKENLRKGPCMDGPEGGWQAIGEKGRSMIAAHNDKEFKNLDRINTGDEIAISMENGDFLFQASEIRIYRHRTDDWNETAYESTEEYGLVLVTCYPLNKRNTTGDRLVVKCKMIDARCK
ncbi:MAG: sortase [Clostridiales bacterium]|nr:sortase [Clostridiales bacterium]